MYIDIVRRVIFLSKCFEMPAKNHVMQQMISSHTEDNELNDEITCPNSFIVSANYHVD